MEKSVLPHLVELTDNDSLIVKVAYADPDYADNHFGALYRPEARLYLHQDLAIVTQRAAEILWQRYGWLLLCLDGLRPIEAQQEMTTFVNQHRAPLAAQGIDVDSLIGKPGFGGHPRGLAIDVHPLQNGHFVEMGTAFDEFTGPCGRDASTFAKPTADTIILRNRRALEQAFVEAAAEYHFPLLPLPQEWWDFRARPEFYESYAPISDQELPANMKMMANTPEYHLHTLNKA